MTRRCGLERGSVLLSPRFVQEARRTLHIRKEKSDGSRRKIAAVASHKFTRAYAMGVDPNMEAAGIEPAQDFSRFGTQLELSQEQPN